MTGTLRRAIDAAAATLAAAGVPSARTDAELLAAYVAGVPRGRLALVDQDGEGFHRGFLPRYDAAVAQRARRVPVQHIIGTAAFGPVTVRVGPGVFTPRPETEFLLEWSGGQSLPPAPVIVDLCTGSGALALALAQRFPAARVVAVDDDARALGYATQNLHETDAELVCGDVADVGLLPELNGIVDLVVANPPYIPDGVPLEPEVAQHDPHHALFGGPDGMALITPIAGHAARWLRPGGLLAVEHDDTTSAQTVHTITATAAFTAVTPHRDLTGRPRFVTAVRREHR